MRAKWLTGAAFLCASLGLGSSASATVLVTGDPVLYWNQLMTSGTTALAGPPPIVARSSAMVNIAVFDAVNAALGSPNASYLDGISASGGDVRAAASQAAHDVLVFLNPAKTPEYDAALTASLALVSDPAARNAGAATGAAYAAGIILARSNDGSAAAQSAYTPGTNPGDWQPTSPAPAALPGWGDVTPFLMNSGDQFRAGPPPALGSAEYAAAYNEVLAIGSASSAIRTADQTAAAQFWALAGGTSWIGIGVGLAEDEGFSTLQYAQLFATLSAGLGDAFIAGFDTKYEYEFWRPVTAIHGGALDGNSLTEPDPLWASLLVAPNHPSYFSTHAIADGTAATILMGFLGDEAFCATFGGLERCWDSILAASQEGADSRIWGGIHFSFDGAAGLAAGHSIGQFALRQGTFQPVPEPSTWLTMLLGFAFIGWSFRRQRRHAHSNSLAVAAA